MEELKELLKLYLNYQIDDEHDDNNDHDKQMVYELFQFGFLLNLNNKCIKKFYQKFQTCIIQCLTIINCNTKKYC